MLNEIRIYSDSHFISLKSMFSVYLNVFKDTQQTGS